MPLRILEVEVDVESPQELNNSSYVLAGLFDLEQAGLVSGVRLTPSLDLHRGEIHVTPAGAINRSAVRAYKTTFLTVHAGLRTVRLAVDFRDAGFVFPEDGLQKADLLLKRTFDDECVSIVSRSFSTRIEPTGLVLRARSSFDRDWRLLAANYALVSMLSATKFDRALVGRWRKAWSSIRQDLKQAQEGNQPTSMLRPSSSDSVRPFIFFQTRTFNRTDDPDANEIHADRAVLIRALRSEFGSQFVGGFVPDSLSTRLYPDCISPVPTDKSSYYAEMNRAAICIYTRGLVNSAALKLSEYLAFGKCIVAEEVKGRLAAPLSNGDTLVHFRSVEECVATCHDLLARPEVRVAMESSARRYYELWVEPSAGMHRMLSTALGVSPAMP